MLLAKRKNGVWTAPRIERAAAENDTLDLPCVSLKLARLLSYPSTWRICFAWESLSHRGGEFLLLQRRPRRPPLPAVERLSTEIQFFRGKNNFPMRHLRHERREIGLLLWAPRPRSKIKRIIFRCCSLDFSVPEAISSPNVRVRAGVVPKAVETND